MEVRPLRESEWRAYRDLRLRALTESPDAFGSTLEVEAARPETDWQNRVAAGVGSKLDLPLVAAEHDRLVGLAWGKIFPTDPDVAHLFQMWISPEHRSRGLGSEMLERIKSWASSLDVAQLALGVTEGDTAARRLYERAGFQPSGALEPLRPSSRLRSQPMRLDLKSSQARCL